MAPYMHISNMAAFESIARAGTRPFRESSYTCYVKPNRVGQYTEDHAGIYGGVEGLSSSTAYVKSTKVGQKSF